MSKFDFEVDFDKNGNFQGSHIERKLELDKVFFNDVIVVSW